MKIDFRAKLKNLSGETLKEQDKEEPILLKDACANALLGMFDDERHIEGKEKLRRYRLANKIWGAKEPIELPAEDIALIKSLVAKAYGSLISGQAWELLDPEETTAREMKSKK